MTKGFWTRLVIPLAVASALATLTHFLIWKADGFFLNLATEFGGILVTVWYVDWVLREHERERWRLTDDRITNRLRILLNAIVSGIRTGIGYGPEILNDRVMDTLNEVAMHKELMRVGEHVISPTLPQRVRSLDVEGWKSLDIQVRHSHNAVLSFLNAFQNRLSPDQICHLLDIQEALSKSMIYYTMFPDIMGVPRDQLPQARTPPEQLQEIGCKHTAEELAKVILLSARLSETLVTVESHQLGQLH